MLFLRFFSLNTFLYLISNVNSKVYKERKIIFFMRLIKQMIEKKLESYQNYSIKKNIIRSIWQFYQSIALANAFLEFNDAPIFTNQQIKIRNKLYQKIILKRNLNTKEVIKMDNFITMDIEILNNCFEIFDKFKSEARYDVPDFNKDSFVAILGSELEELR